MYRQDWEALSKHVAYKTSLKQIWNLELGSRRREPRACAGTSCAQVLISRGPSLQRFFSEHTEPSQGKLNINAYLTMCASVGTLPLGLIAQARVRARTCALTRTDPHAHLHAHPQANAQEDLHAHPHADPHADPRVGGCGRGACQAVRHPGRNHEAPAAAANRDYYLAGVRPRLVVSKLTASNENFT